MKVLEGNCSRERFYLDAITEITIGACFVPRIKSNKCYISKNISVPVSVYISVVSVPVLFQSTATET